MNRQVKRREQRHQAGVRGEGKINNKYKLRELQKIHLNMAIRLPRRQAGSGKGDLDSEDGFGRTALLGQCCSKDWYPSMALSPSRCGHESSLRSHLRMPVKGARGPQPLGAALISTPGLINFNDSLIVIAPLMACC